MQGGGGGATTPSLEQSLHPSIIMETSAPDSSAPAENWLKKWKGVKARRCEWTVHNYTEEEVEKLRRYADQCRYIVWGYEIAPDTGTPHLQGFVCWDASRSLIAFRDAFTTKNIYLRIDAVGPHSNFATYCKKPESKDLTKPQPYEEYGDLPHQGKRSDWDKVITDLRTKSVIDVLDENPHLIPMQKALREVKQMFLKPITRTVNVVVLWGRGGTGKTRWAFDNYPDIYKKPTGEWWDGYAGQKAVLFDDYYGYFKYHDLLTVLDRYPLNLPYKGGFVWAQYDTVIITSNKHPKDWYHTQWGWPLRRRLNKIIEVKCIDGKTSYEAEEFPADEEAWRAQETAYAIDA